MKELLVPLPWKLGSAVKVAYGAYYKDLSVAAGGEVFNLTLFVLLKSTYRAILVKIFALI